MTVSELVQRLVKGMNEGTVHPDSPVLMVDEMETHLIIEHSGERCTVYITDVNPNGETEEVTLEGTDLYLTPARAILPKGR